MLTPVLDSASPMPLYEQIYRHIRREIESGSLPAGSRLPSKRALAAHLEVSVVTVEGAYGQLLAEGYLRSEPKRGFFVRTPELAGPRQPFSAPYHPPVPTAPSSGTLEYDFATNAVDTAHFPFSTWAKLMREVLSQQDSDLLSSPPPQGVPELREAIVRYLHDFRGIQASAEQVVVGAGSEYLTSILLQLLGQDGGWAVEDPGYRKFYRILSHAGALACPIPLDGQGMRTDALHWSGARVAHITPSHHFPLGTVMPVARRQALLAWASEAENRYLIEDDYDSEFRYDGRPIPALQSLDTRERVVYMNTFTKSLAPSLRIGYMVLPPHLLERYQKEFLFYSSTVPSFEQYTLARFLSRGHFERHIRRMRNTYRLRRDSLLAAAKAAGITRLGHFSGAEAGLHLLFRAPGGPSEEELVQAAARAGVGVYPLSYYCLTPPEPDHVPTLMLGYARLEPEDMAPAMRRLYAAWSPLFRSRETQA